MGTEPLAIGAAVAQRPAGVSLRAPVAVLLSRFPLVTETFILREIDELERQGQPVRLVPLLRADERVVHPEARPWVERALYTPFLSAEIGAAVWRRLRGDARRTLRLLARLFAGCRRSPGVALRTLALFPKALYLAERLVGEGIGHLHAHYATYPATVAYVVSELAGIPYSVTVHAHDLFVDRSLLAEKVRRATWVRTISRYNRETLLRLFPELPPQRVRVIHVGVDPARYAGAAATPVPAGEPPTLLAVAGLKPYKGLPVLLQACDLLRRRGIDFRCDIVGEGPQRRTLERQIRRLRLGDRARLLGARPQEEVANRLAVAAVVVVPSVVAADGQMEGIPVVLMEAMAARRPVVASALSGIPELVEHEVTGTLVPPGDAPALAAALERRLREPLGRAATLDAAARRVDEQFRLDRGAAGLARLLEPELPPLPAELAAAAGACAGTLGEGPWLPRAVWRRRDSTVARFARVGPASTPDLILKVHRSFPGASRPAAARARDEGDRLHRLAGLLAGPASGEESQLAVPRLLAVIPEVGAVLMRACEGTPIDELLRAARWSGPRRWRSALAALTAAGEWLGRLHSRWPAAAPPQEVLARLHGECADALEEDGELAAAELRRLWGRLDRFAAEVGDLDVTARHGDFWPGNVFVGPGRCEAIDFEGLCDGLAGEDVAYFLLHLEGFLAGSPLVLRRRAASRAFLDGYLAGRQLDPAQLRLCRLAAALRIRRHLAPAAGASRRRLLAEALAA